MSYDPYSSSRHLLVRSEHRGNMLVNDDNGGLGLAAKKSVEYIYNVIYHRAAYITELRTFPWYITLNTNKLTTTK